MQSEQTIVEKLHSETARICWYDLQPYFAKGSILSVDSSLDLIAVAVDFAQDKASTINDMLESSLIAPPSNEQARSWHANNDEFWAVVVAPFVLIQLIDDLVDESKAKL